MLLFPLCVSVPLWCKNMKDTILLVGHGSRDARGNEEIERFADMWRKAHPDWRIDLCFIEFADVLLDEGLDRAAGDSDRVIIVPLILNAAGHVKMEIPRHIAEARSRHAGVEFLYVRHLGVGEETLRAMQGQLGAVRKVLDVPDAKTTGVIVLGRGSSDMTANGEVARLARWMFEQSDHEIVDTAFTGITGPRLETAVQRQTRIGMTQIVVLPFYLFTGVLIERIRRQVERLKLQYPAIAFGLGSYIGFDEAIFGLADKRVAEARGEADGRVMMECEGCKYRAFAEEHGYGHCH